MGTAACRSESRTSDSPGSKTPSTIVPIRRSPMRGSPSKPPELHDAVREESVVPATRKQPVCSPPASVTLGQIRLVTEHPDAELVLHALGRGKLGVRPISLQFAPSLRRMRVL